MRSIARPPAGGRDSPIYSDPRPLSPRSGEGAEPARAAVPRVYCSRKFALARPDGSRPSAADRQQVAAEIGRRLPGCLEAISVSPPSRRSCRSACVNIRSAPTIARPPALPPSPGSRTTARPEVELHRLRRSCSSPASTKCTLSPTSVACSDGSSGPASRSVGWLHRAPGEPEQGQQESNELAFPLLGVRSGAIDAPGRRVARWGPRSRKIETPENGASSEGPPRGSSAIVSRLAFRSLAKNFTSVIFRGL
jgi:hypothetical protein